MSRAWVKTKGDIPKKIYIQQKVGLQLFGPYFQKTKAPDGYVEIEYRLCEKTGNFLRYPSLEIGKKKSLDL